MDVFTCMLSFGLTCSAPEPSGFGTASVEDVTGIAADTRTSRKGDASKLVAKVEVFYDGLADFEATFTQTYVHPVYGTKTVSSGSMRVKKPGKMVWDYSAEDSPDFWIDSKTALVVERDTKQVVKVDVESSDFAGAMKFLLGGRQVLDDFRVRLAGEKLVKRYGNAGHTAVEMQPRAKNPHYQFILLVIDDSTGRVDAFVVLNGDGSTNHFVLENFEGNAGLTDEKFKFIRPKGFALVDG
jgi:outer membrane lipoprotein carrier protein